MATQLGSDDLQHAVSGKTVTIDTPLGLPITVNYGANGLMTGTAGAALGVYLGAGKDRGRWHVRNGKLCQKWFKWLSGDTTCLTLRREGTRIFWRSDEGQSGTATIEAGPPAFDGVTASGLGVPPPPKKVAAAAPPPANAGIGEAAPKSAPDNDWKAAVNAERPRPKAEHHHPAAVAHDTQHETKHSAEPRLVQAIAPAVRPPITLASLAPIPRHAVDGNREVAFAPAALPDPFDAPPESMRRAADLVVLSLLEHRWCHSNAFAKDPMPPTVTGRFAAPEVVSVPSLLAVSEEQDYAGALPLHQASCLTEDPAINVLAKLSGGLD